MNYPLVITSHVNLFGALFGTGREQSFPLIKLCNSVVIIDEIQSYRNEIWHEVILFLLQYAELLNIKFIIMSATLPKLDGLLGQHSHQIIDLIKNPDVYYQNPFF
jgi:CRISPR-associated endonuclease/helicase Cas3